MCCEKKKNVYMTEQLDYLFYLIKNSVCGILYLCVNVDPRDSSRW